MSSIQIQIWMVNIIGFTVPPTLSFTLYQAWLLQNLRQESPVPIGSIAYCWSLARVWVSLQAAQIQGNHRWLWALPSVWAWSRLAQLREIVGYSQETADLISVFGFSARTSFTTVLTSTGIEWSSQWIRNSEMRSSGQVLWSLKAIVLWHIRIGDTYIYIDRISFVHTSHHAGEGHSTGNNQEAQIAHFQDAGKVGHPQVVRRFQCWLFRGLPGMSDVAIADLGRCGPRHVAPQNRWVGWALVLLAPSGSHFHQ